MSATIDQQFIEYIVKAIVGNPDAVTIERTIDEKGVLLQLTVDGEDLGRVIGKRGSGAQALRTLLRALGTKNDARYNLKIVDVNGERPPRREEHAEKDETSVDEDAVEAAEESPVEEVVAKEKIEEKIEEPESETLSFADDDDEPETEDKEDDSDSMAAKTRRELADLDDLDI